MTIKGIIDEDFVNYKVPSMTLMFPKCSFKCGHDLCQNSEIANQPDIVVDSYKICRRYLDNDITSAVVIQGLEPFDSWDDLYEFLIALRIHYYCYDDVVIYTGYNRDEIEDKIGILQRSFTNIVIKFGRYIPNQTSHYDNVLEVNLASDNQYAERIS